MTYRVYEFTGASIQVGDGDWIPITTGAQSLILNYDMPPVDTGWYIGSDGRPFRMDNLSVTLSVDKIRRVSIARLFYPGKPTIARRKIWRYMEHCGL